MQLDFIVPPRRTAWGGVLVLALALGVAGVLALEYREARLEQARLVATAELVGPERRPARALPKERLAEETKSAEAVVRELTLPWAPLIRALEDAAMREVAILQLQPDAHTRLVRLSAEARTQEAMFEYVRRLGASKTLADTHLVSHQVQREDPQRPIQFSVQATIR